MKRVDLIRAIEGYDVATLKLSLTDGLMQFVEAEASAGGFASPGDYVQEILLQAYRGKAKRDLEASLLQRIETIDRGEVVEMTEEDWAEIRAEVERDFQEKRNNETANSSKPGSQE